jgi:retron-type reverse transcriptase
MHFWEYIYFPFFQFGFLEEWVLLLKLYETSIALEYVPAKWREVTVIFIPKPGKSDYTDKRAFRPISLMSVLFNKLERLVLWHIEETNLTNRPMHESQYSFRKGKSTDQALSKAMNIIKKGLNQGEYVLGVFCDISGAFDNVLHSSITSAMSRRGIDNTIIKWYDHFLKTRTVTSTLGGTEAAIRPGKGAPQGGGVLSHNIMESRLRRLPQNV